MDETLRKKVNLLVHLAKSDGKFHVSEKAFLIDLLRQRGVENFNFDSVTSEINPLKEMASILNKQELIYWCLQLIKADGIVHTDEMAYCKALAHKLKFSPAIIDKYSIEQLPLFEIFTKDLQNFIL